MAVVYVNPPPSSQYASCCSESTAAIPTWILSTPSTAVIAGNVSLLPLPATFLFSPFSSMASSSLTDGNSTTRHYHHQHYHHLLHQLVSVSTIPLPPHHHSTGFPPPLIAETEDHSPVFNSCPIGFRPPISDCSYPDAPVAVSSAAAHQQWWPSQPQQQSVGSGTAIGEAEETPSGPSSWSAPPIPVSGHSATFTYPPSSEGRGTLLSHPVGLRPLSPMSPLTGIPPPPLSAPPSSLPLEHSSTHLPHVDTGPIATSRSGPATGTIPGGPPAIILPPQQRRLRRVACTCSNCASGANSEATNPDGSPREKQHICDYPNCNKVYRNTTHLQDHIRLHMGERLYVCRWFYCGKRFTRSDELQRHLRTHTRERKFICQECNKRFVRRDHLKKHIKTHQKMRKEEAPSGDTSRANGFVDTFQLNPKEQLITSADSTDI